MKLLKNIKNAEITPDINIENFLPYLSLIYEKIKPEHILDRYIIDSIHAAKYDLSHISLNSDIIELYGYISMESYSHISLQSIDCLF